MVAACATLSACLGSPRKAGPDVSPITPAATATRHVERTVCPIDLYAPLPQKPAPAEGAIVEGNDTGLAFVAAMGIYGASLLGVILDSREACPPATPPRSG